MSDITDGFELHGDVEGLNVDSRISIEDASIGNGSFGNGSSDYTESCVDEGLEFPFKGYTILGTCTGCGTCLSICPTKAILGGPGKVHTIDADLCILCGSCARVCPNSCIEDSSGTIAQRLGKRFWSIPHFNEDECKGCGMCISMCPSGVLVRSGGPASTPTVTNPKLCASCRICSKVCVFDAVEFFPASNGNDILFDIHQVEPGEGE